MNRTIDHSILRSEEKAIFSLRSLYRNYGYLPFKMSKFEEYEFYIQNKDFLVSDRIIAFNDTNGKLLALKPDVTLSIIKNGEDGGGKQKVCYNENVYRVSENTHQFKEIMQTGIECIGSVDAYDIYEVLHLACRSLELLSEDFVLEISHLGLISGLLEKAGVQQGFRQEVLQYLSEKNSHDLSRICQEQGVCDELRDMLLALVQAYGPRQKVLESLKAYASQLPAGVLEELEALSEMLDALPCNHRIVFDFSCLNNMNYYNGIVFRGYLAGLSQSVLTGGQYDKLLRKMNRKAGAVGFAIYLDLLAGLPGQRADRDVDVLLLYDPAMPPQKIARKVEELLAAGKTVSSQTAIPAKLRYGELLDLRKED